MGERRTSSAPAWLLALSLILLSLGPIASLLLDWNFVGGQGAISYGYSSGSSPIVSITFTLPHDLASSMVVDGASSGFSASLSGDVLTLSQGTLFPGQALQVNYHLVRYVSPGDRTYSTTALTGAGMTIQAPGEASVQQNVILQLFTIIADNSLPLEVLGAAGAVGAGALLIRRRTMQDEGPLLDEAPGGGTTPPTGGGTTPTGGGTTPTGERPKTQEKPQETPITPTTDNPPTPTTPDEKKKPTAYGVDLTKCPKPWLPEGTNTVSFTATIWKCVPGQGWVPSDVPKVITFLLSGVSREKGICLNKGEGKGMDLWFPKKENEAEFNFFDPEGDTGCEATILGVKNKPHTHYPKVRTKKPVLQATVVVRSEDFGAWGWLEATAEGCVEIPPRENIAAPVNCPPGVCCAGSNKIKIPRDEDDNNIADAAAQNATGAGEEGAKKDEDDTPTGDGTKGDGLTAYEEYRGFIVNEGPRYSETHIRTDIKTKDVFVYLEGKPADLDHLGYFTRTDLAVHKITDQKLINTKENREVNFNRGYATGGLQHALWLRNWGSLKVYGRACGLKTQQGWEDETQPEAAIVGPPVTKSHICVNVSKCRGKDYMGAAEPDGRLEQVIAHELGHGVNLSHHGEDKRHGHERSGKKEPDYFFLTGGLSSGPANCIMRYDRHAEGWCSSVAPDDPRTHTKHQTYWDSARKSWFGGESPGTQYCESQTGDGVNKDSGATNDADVGNCKNHLKVKDW